MADPKQVKVFDGTNWVDLQSNTVLPVAASDGKSQVNGVDGLIVIENTEDGGEAGMTFATKADGTRWQAKVEEGLLAGQLQFTNAAGQTVFALTQSGEVLIPQGTSENGASAATRTFVESLMNSGFPIISDDGGVNWARIDTDQASNYRAIYFGIGGQSVENPDRVLEIAIKPDPNAGGAFGLMAITAHEDYTPTDQQDLVTLSYFDANKGDGPPGADGKGWTGGSYDSGTGVVTFTSDDGLGFNTGDLRGADGANGTNGAPGTDGTNGTDGKGWTGGSYNASNGIVTFTSDDGLGFNTGDLRGADGTNGTNGAPGTNGTDGKGWTGGSYNSTNGIVTFTSDDGLGFNTGDLRGSNGTDGTNGTNGTDGKGWTDGSYDESTGVVTFTSNDGLGFTTGDLRGADGADGQNGGDGTPPDQSGGRLTLSLLIRCPLKT